MTVFPELSDAIGATYVLERELGGGGMSRVFLATERALGRRVVLKLLSAELSSGVSLERFKREIHVLAQLQHPNIVPLLAAGEAMGLPYYTMPFVEGESLRARLSRTGELTVGDAVHVLRDVARALAYAHGRNVVHRDIKPDNVLLSGDYALVADFGIGKALSAARTHGDESLTQMGVAIGTPAYMAPEQASGDSDVDHRADIYSFGCLAYEMLSGVPPFSGRTPQALIAAHVTATPPSLSERRASIPPALAQLIMRCLEKRPSDRPQSAQELIGTLDAVATPVTGTIAETRLSSPAPRSRRRLGFITVVTAAVAAAIAVSVGRRDSPAPVDQALVAVLPFRVSAADPSLRPLLREGMMDLISAKLTGGLRAVDPRTVMTAFRRAGGAENADLPEAQSVAVAKAVGAAHVLQGEVVGTPSHLVMTAGLTNVGRSSGSVRAQVTGGVNALAVLVDSLVAKLLVLGAGGDEQQAVALAGTPFPALQAYLEGQRDYRAGRYLRAMDAFVRAVDIDSTFAHAALGMELAGGWALDARRARGLELALRYRHKLGARDQWLLPIARSETSPMSCREALAEQERNTQRAADVPELWYELGDNLFHCGHAMGMKDAWPRAMGAFERALAIDSSFAPAWEHIPDGKRLMGDTAGARAALTKYLKYESDYAQLSRYLLADSAERERQLPRLIKEASFPKQMLNAYITLWNGDMRGVEQVLAAGRAAAVTEGDRGLLLAAERVYSINAGQPARAARIARQMPLYVNARRMLDMVFQDGDSALAAEAARTVARSLAASAPVTSNAWVNDVFAYGQYALATGRAVEATRALGVLRSLKATGDSAWIGAVAQRGALVLDAQIAAVSRRADAARLLAAADSMLRDAPPGRLTRSAGNLAIARLWELKGDAGRAYDASQRVYYTSTEFTPFWSTIKLEGGRLALAAGDTSAAITSYRAYVRLRSNPEPSLRLHMESVRRELARLERATAGR